MRKRAVCVVIRGGKVLFVEQMVYGQKRRVFIGGGIEAGESPSEAALRELDEEANVAGKIVFGPVIWDKLMKEYIFVVSISGDARPTLGYDPELAADGQEIKGLVWLDLAADAKLFSEVDMEYFRRISAHWEEWEWIDKTFRQNLADFIEKSEK